MSGCERQIPIGLADVDWDLKQPCADCPFLKSSPYHEGVAASLGMYMDSITKHEFSHSCHKTDSDPNCDGPHTWNGNQKHCAGAIIMVLKSSNAFFQMPMLLAAQAKKFDLNEMRAIAESDTRVFTIPQLLKFYAKKLRKLIRADEMMSRRRGYRAEAE